VAYNPKYRNFVKEIDLSPNEMTFFLDVSATVVAALA
jgi:hypothetical protein